MDSNLKRSIILDNYQNPVNRRKEDNNPSYEKLNTRNVSCIDNIDLYIKIKDNVIEDISFDGEACAISISSTSIMTNILKGKKIEEAIKIIEEYEKMIDEKEYDKGLIKEAIVYEDISKQPARIKCATLTWNGLYKKLKEIQNKSNI